MKKIFVFLFAFFTLVAFGGAQDLPSDVQALKSAYSGSGTIDSLDSQTIVIEPKMPAPLCAVPENDGGQTTWKYYAFPLAAITVPLTSIDEKLIGVDVVFTNPEATKNYKPGDKGDSTIVIVAGLQGKQFHTLLYDRDKFIRLGPGPHAASDYGQMPDDTEAFALVFADPAAAQSFAATLKKAVMLAKAQASLAPVPRPGTAR